MQIITLELENLNLYSPSTGEVLCHEETGYNEEAQSLMGYWVQEVMDDPFIKNPDLQQAWDRYMEQSDARLEADDEYPGPDVDEFLEQYDHPTWIAFRIETFGMIGDVAWFVVEMEIADEDEKTEGSENLKSEKPGGYDPAARNVSLTSKEGKAKLPLSGKRPAP